jgi:hypothetical protein
MGSKFSLLLLEQKFVNLKTKLALANKYSIVVQQKKTMILLFIRYEITKLLFFFFEYNKYSIIAWWLLSLLSSDSAHIHKSRQIE